ncbi:hypothetical protein BDF19DRAFT_450947 [Syncephalis fuscata]|nr:hypothetical protein BDF19DRAFT_450947 [Syncephalis fuscata]
MFFYSKLYTFKHSQSTIQQLFLHYPSRRSITTFKMVKLLYSAYVAAGVLALFFNTHTTHAIGGTLDGDPGPDAAGRKFVDQNLKALKIDNIKWVGGNSELSFALLNGKKGFLKCGTKLGGEAVAFDMLLNAETALKGNDALGRENIMRPISKFATTTDPKAGCLIYNFITGDSFMNTITSNMLYQNSGKLVSVVYQILQGVQYLHRANIAHMDLLPNNVIVSEDLKTKRIMATIIDYDKAVPLAGNSAQDCKKDNRFIAVLINRSITTALISKNPPKENEQRQFMQKKMEMWFRMLESPPLPQNVEKAIDNTAPLLNVLMALNAENSDCSTIGKQLNALRPILIKQIKEGIVGWANPASLVG